MTDHPTISESREGASTPPEAEPIPAGETAATNPEPREGHQATPAATDGANARPAETAGTDPFEIPPFLKRNPDNSLPGRDAA